MERVLARRRRAERLCGGTRAHTSTSRHAVAWELGGPGDVSHRWPCTQRRTCPICLEASSSFLRWPGRMTRLPCSSTICTRAKTRSCCAALRLLQAARPSFPDGIPYPELTHLEVLLLEQAQQLQVVVAGGEEGVGVLGHAQLAQPAGGGRRPPGEALRAVQRAAGHRLVLLVVLVGGGGRGGRGGAARRVVRAVLAPCACVGKSAESSEQSWWPALWRGACANRPARLTRDIDVQRHATQGSRPIA